MKNFKALQEPIYMSTYYPEFSHYKTVILPIEKEEPEKKGFYFYLPDTELTQLEKNLNFPDGKNFGLQYSVENLFEFEPLFKIHHSNTSIINDSLDIGIHEWWHKDRDRMINGFNLDKNGKLKDGELNRLITIKNETSESLKLLAEDINEIDRSIVGVLRIFLYETHKEIMKISDEKKERELVADLYCRVQDYFQLKIRGIGKASELLERLPSKLLYSPYTPKPVKYSTTNGLRTFIIEKKPLLKKFNRLLEKFLVVNRAITLGMEGKSINVNKNKSDERGNPNFQSIGKETIRKIAETANMLLEKNPEEYKPIKTGAFLSNRLKIELSEKFDIPASTIYDNLKRNYVKSNGLFKYKND